MTVEVALPERQEEILRLVVAGKTEGQIADRLRVSVNTVKTHKRRLFQAFNVSSRDELLAASVSYLTAPAPREEPTEGLRLRERQFDVLRLAAQGYSAAEMGRELWLTEATVNHHLRQAFRALGARDRGQAVALAVAHEVIAIGLDEDGEQVVTVLMDEAGPIPCPSEAGHTRHRARKEEPCDGCRAAHSAYMREWRKRKAS